MDKQTEPKEAAGVSQARSIKSLAVRPLRFRAWDGETFHCFDLNDSGKVSFDYLEVFLRLSKQQFTGLYDKSGKEDWDGDFVKVKIGNQNYIRPIFCSASGAWAINLPVMSFSSTKEEPVMLITIEHENIGNIFENADLLEHS